MFGSWGFIRRDVLASVPASFKGLVLFINGEEKLQLDVKEVAKNREVSVKTAARLIQDWVHHLRQHASSYNVAYYANGILVEFDEQFTLVWDGNEIALSKRPNWHLGDGMQSRVIAFERDVKAMRRFRLFLVWSFRQWGLPKDLARWVVQLYFQDPIKGVRVFF